MPKIQIEISARHIHLCQKDLNKLFGKGYELKKLKDLSQIGQFACQETVAIKTKSHEFGKVRILGPVRRYTQVEISLTDACKLGLDPPFRQSGAIKDSAGIKIVGSRGMANLKNGVIIAKRHIHASPAEAQKYGLKEDQKVSVKVRGERALIFQNVAVRISQAFIWRMHLDTDEANAAGIKGAGCQGELILQRKD